MRITRYRVLAATLALVAIALIGPPQGGSDRVPLSVRALAQTGVLTGYLSDNIKIVKIADHSTADTTLITSSAVDMQGYTCALFITSYGTAASGNTFAIQSSSDDGSADAYTDLTGTEVGVSTSDEDVWEDICRPRERYLKVTAERGTSSTLESIWVIQYGARSLPQDNTTAGTIHGEQTNSPAEGTE